MSWRRSPGRGTREWTGTTVGASPGPGSAGEMRMTFLPSSADAARVSCFLADHLRWSAYWDKKYGLWRVAEDGPRLRPLCREQRRRRGDRLHHGAQRGRSSTMPKQAKEKGGLVAAYVRTVKTASGGTAVQVVHPTHHRRTLHDALDRIHRHSGTYSLANSGQTPVKAAHIRRPAGKDSGCAWPPGSRRATLDRTCASEGCR